MDGFFNNPFVQSAVIPFVVAFSLAILLAKWRTRWVGFAVPVAIFVAVFLIHGFDFFPLRSTNKIFLLGSIAVVVAVLFELLPWRRWRTGLLVAVVAAMAVWLVWPRLGRLDGLEWWLTVVVPIVYAAWWCIWADYLKDRPIQALNTYLLLGFATAICATLGATALYGQVAGAVAAACGALWLLWLFKRPIAAGWLVVLPASVLLLLLGIGAVVYAKLAWYSLALFALIPVCVMIPLPQRWPQWLLGGGGLVLGALPVIVAIYLTWTAAEGLVY